MLQHAQRKLVRLWKAASTGLTPSTCPSPVVIDRSSYGPLSVGETIFWPKLLRMVLMDFGPTPRVTSQFSSSNGY
eukprot:scaffold1090_cov265-Pinguiococcus_pyrenoidosus.AAC.26